MRILITGGAGFLGSHLSDLLIGKGHEIVAMDNLITGRVENISHLMGNPSSVLSSTTSVTIFI